MPNEAEADTVEPRGGEACRIEFDRGGVILPRGSELRFCLGFRNSPVLFGCRTGLCATCLVEVSEVRGELAPPDGEESEILEVYAPGNPRARLACRLRAEADMRLRYIGAADAA